MKLIKKEIFKAGSLTKMIIINHMERKYFWNKRVGTSKNNIITKIPFKIDKGVISRRSKNNTSHPQIDSLTITQHQN